MASESTRQRRRGLPPSLHLRRHHHPQTGIQPQIPTTHATRRSRERFPRSLSNSSDSSISSSSSSSSSTSSSVSVEIQNSNNIGERTTALALLSLARKKNKTHRGRGRTRRRSSNPLQNNTNNYIHVSSSRRNRRKRRHPETKKELPFVWLFLRVAAVLFGVCYGTHCAFWMAHNHTNAIRRTFGLRAPRTTTGISTLDDDDNNNRADSSQDHPSGGAMAPSSAAATTIPQPDAIPPVRQQVKTASDPAVGAVVVVAPVFPLLQPQDSHPRTVAADASSKNSSTILVLNTLLRDRLRHDAFGIAERYASYIGSNKTMAAADNDGGDSNSAAGTAKNQALFWQTAAGLREKFASLYGGEKEARAMLIRGLTVFGQTKPFRTFTKNTKSRDDSEPKSSLHDDLQQTACRIHRARQSSHRTFRFAFGGYSVTAGRGNRFQQSFPLVMEQQLHTVFRLMDLNLIVKNAAIGGCPSFPYGFCMSNFWGEAPDVVSWDFSMNEAGGDPMSLESYLRRILSEYSPYPPKLIVKDTHMASDRRNLLQYYFNQSVNLAELTTARDLVIVHTDPAARPFLDQPESGRPEGFRDWRKFGGPPDAPGQSMHHPAVKEHEFIAWLLTMHFLSALEILAVADTMDNAEASVFLWNQCHAFDNEVAVAARKGQRLPKPLYDSTTFRDEPWTSLLFGEETFLTRSDSVSTDNYWKMNRVQCRTSFEPIVSGDLSDMVVSGSIGEDVDIMLPKSNMFYNSGWVLDLSDSEKKAKRSLNRFGGLGFVDRKKAYYGIVSSGTIRFFLTHSADNSPVDSSQPLVGDNALLWFKSVVICEVNEQRSANACNTEKDVLFTVGGVNATDVTMLDAAGTKFLGKRLCVYLAVPETAVLTSHADLAASTDKLLRAPKLHTIGDEVGMVVTATVQSKHIYRREEACSISHLVWEQHPSKDLDVKYLRSNERM